jgi:hypothetical protein
MYVSTMPMQMTRRSPMTLGAYRRVARVRRSPQTLGLSNSPELSAGVKAATVAANFIPVVGPEISAIIGPVVGLFTASHTAAVQKEGQTMNQAMPNFLNSVQQIMAALNAGQISPTSAISALQSAQSTYYSAVSSIIKKGGACTPAPNGLALTGCCNSSSTCNAACCIGCCVVEPAVLNLTEVIQAGGGTWTIPPTQNNGAIAGTPSLSLTYNGAMGTGGVTGAVAAMGIPSWAWLAGGGLIVILLLKR